MIVRRIFVAVAACLGCAAAPAVAAPLQQLCTAEQGFGYRFGEPIDAGVPASAFRANVTLGAGVLPFRRAEIMIAQDSRRIHRINAEASFASDGAARTFIVAVRDAYRAAGWTPTEESQALMGDLSQVGLPIIDIAMETGGGPQRRRLEIMTLGRDVIVSCAAPSLTGEALREWLAPPQVGEARPQPPVLPTGLDSLRPPACSGGDSLASIEAGLETWMQEWQPYAAAVSRHYEQLVEWSGQRLVQSGRWTAERKRAFEAELLERPEVSGPMQAILQGSMQMLIDLSEVADLEQAGRRTEACTRVVAMFARIPEMAALTARQSAEIDRIYRAEARRLGVSLD